MTREKYQPEISTRPALLQTFPCPKRPNSGTKRDTRSLVSPPERYASRVRRRSRRGGPFGRPVPSSRCSGRASRARYPRRVRAVVSEETSSTQLGSNNAQPGGAVHVRGDAGCPPRGSLPRGRRSPRRRFARARRGRGARDVRALLSHHRPDAVVLELCAERAGAAIAAALASSRGTGAGSRREDDANDAGPAGPRPPGVVPNAVSIRGLPVDRPLPGASPDDLLAQLRCQPGRLAAPRTSTRTSGPSWSPDSSRRYSCTSPREKVKPLMTCPGRGRTTGGERRGFKPGGGSKKQISVLYCAGGACGDGVAEVIVGASVEFRCALDSSLAVTADVRFAWSEKAAKKLGAIPRTSRRTCCAEPRCCCWSTTRAGREVATTKTGTKSRHPVTGTRTGTGTGMGTRTRTRRRERAPR